MGNTKKHEYYVKKEGVVSKIDKKEFDQINRSLKSDNKRYLCPSCKVCTCQKIKYTDINRCEKVNLATFKKSYTNVDNVQLIERDFKVYDCNEYDMYSDLKIKHELIIKHEILQLSNKIYGLLLKSDPNNKEVLEELYELKNLKKQQLQDYNIINELEEEEEGLYNKYVLLRKQKR